MGHDHANNADRQRPTRICGQVAADQTPHQQTRPRCPAGRILRISCRHLSRLPTNGADRESATA